MKEIDYFSLEKHTGMYDTWPLRSRLFINGEFTSQNLPGYKIKAQYKCASGYLIITSWDCPFEEAATFILISPEYKILAQKSLGKMYSSYLLYSHKVLSETSLELDFSEWSYIISIEPSLFRRRPKLVLTKINNEANMKVKKGV